VNAVEIEEAVSKLAEQPFDPASFLYDFLEPRSEIKVGVTGPILKN